MAGVPASAVCLTASRKTDERSATSAMGAGRSQVPATPPRCTAVALNRSFNRLMDKTVSFMRGSGAIDRGGSVILALAAVLILSLHRGHHVHLDGDCRGFQVVVGEVRIRPGVVGVHVGDHVAHYQGLFLDSRSRDRV